MYLKTDIKKILISIITVIILLFSNINAQNVKMGIGYNMNIASNNIENSFFGLKTFVNINLYKKLSLKTNFSLNLQDFKRNLGFKQLSSALFIPLEESFEYHLNYENTKPYFGIGIGYYMVATNSFGIATPIVNTNYIVASESLDNNMGYNFTLGLVFNKINLFMEAKYIILNSIFRQELDHQTTPFERERIINNILLNTLSFSFGYIFSL